MLSSAWFANVAWLLAATFSFAQETPYPHFEVASVKPASVSGFGPFSGGPGSSDPERVTFGGTTLEVLIQEAYGVQADQISGPDWLRSEWYTVTAKLPPGTTREQYRQMMANLLAERFGLKVHRASKEVAGYNLTVTPGGPKLGSAVESTERFAPFSNRRGDDGKMHATFANTSMAVLANRLGMVLSTGQRALPGSRPESVRVIDQTGIAGRFDFKFEFTAPSIPGLSFANGTNVGAEDIPGLVNEALAKQLGLKLIPRKITLDLVIVDHAERVPSAN
jgi:uncharacterized protein (TIGR03435 family)